MLPLKHGTWGILQGHVMEQLRQLPDCSVHMGVTSPPYWGLRSYSTEGQVWGGDPACVHEWGHELVVDQARGEHRSKKQAVASDARGAERGAFCTRCGAWRGELGLEPSVSLFIEHMVEVFREVRRVLRKDGTLWLNMGDSYVAGPTGHQDIRSSNGKARDMFAKGGRYRLDNMRKDGASMREWEGLKPKDLCMIPFRLALALQADGWWVRSDIIWNKPTAMPESCSDRPHKAHEYIFLLAKSKRYFYDAEAIRTVLAEKTYTTFGTTRTGQNTDDPRVKSANWRGTERQPALNSKGKPLGGHKRTVWTVSSQPYKGAHFATFPPKLIEPCIKAGTSEHGVCAECGAPWRRIVDRGQGSYGARKAQGLGGPYNQNPEMRRRAVASIGYSLTPTANTTTGWQPTCTCVSVGVVPAVVFDPFSGAGTTVMVALRLGRRGLGIELSDEYLAQSERRIIADAPLFNASNSQEAEGELSSRGVAEPDMRLLPGSGYIEEQQRPAGNLLETQASLGSLGMLAQGSGKEEDSAAA